jgi:FkbM family methyltransferase|tara:strand:+ start:2029 stop:2661 length:633 start_codon:yes stop_codon:yes gene_type:complete
LEITRNIPALEFLKTKINIETIIDVGVQECTPFLMKAFPDKKHILFEAIEEWRPYIEDIYNGMDYRLYNFGLADINSYVELEVAPFMLAPAENSQSIVFGPAKRKIQFRRLDDVALREKVPYLIKIDVDGGELKVIEGGAETFRKAAVVIIEGRLHGAINMTTIINFMLEVNFKLWDMFNLRYSKEGQLIQCELVFLNISSYEKSQYNKQ